MSITLKSDRLSVEIMDPQEALAVTDRYDNACLMNHVILDGEHEFTVFEPQQRGPGTGYGLCSWFNFRNTCNEVEVGEKFLRVGVGVGLKDKEGPMDILHPYPIEPFDIKITHTDSTAEFETVSPNVNGYAYHCIKKVEVVGNEIVQHIYFKNIGDKFMNLTEFNHNFISLERLPMSEDYYVEFTVHEQEPSLPRKTGDALYGCGNGIGVLKYSNVNNLIDIAPEDAVSVPFYAKVTNKKSKLTFKEAVTEWPCRITVYANDILVSPECVVRLELNPGEDRSWTRRWTFTD